MASKAELTKLLHKTTCGDSATCLWGGKDWAVSCEEVGEAGVEDVLMLEISRVEVEAWEAAHDAFCPMRRACSVHGVAGDRIGARRRRG